MSDTITYPGANGSHTITINRTQLQNVLGPGYSLGPNNYDKGPTLEFNQIQKWGDRAFE